MTRIAIARQVMPKPTYKPFVCMHIVQQLMSLLQLHLVFCGDCNQKSATLHITHASEIYILSLAAEAVSLMQSLSPTMAVKQAAVLSVSMKGMRLMKMRQLLLLISPP